MKILGLIAIMRVDIDQKWVREVWGEEAEKRVNGLMTQCLIYGMSSGQEAIFKMAVPEVVGVMEGRKVFGIKTNEGE